jgi:hypothetical protein
MIVEKLDLAKKVGFEPARWCCREQLQQQQQHHGANIRSSVEEVMSRQPYQREQDHIVGGL